MSGSGPATPQRRELEIMRVLFERRLKDRAIALADSRFPGAGKMVDLAYEWSQLEPTERRERLSNIGPEEIARLREFAALNPDLARAVDELDRRGVLPPIEAAAIDIAAATRETQPAGESPAATVEQAAQNVAEPESVDAEPVAATPESSQTTIGASQDEPLEYDFEDADIDQLTVDMPDLDLGLPSTEQVLEEETHRREEAARAAEEAMERVRSSLDRATQRAFDRSSAIGSPKMPEITRPTLPSLELQQPEPADTTPSVTKAIEAPSSLARHLEKHVVATIRPGDPVPTVDELVALANERQLGFTEHTIALGNRKETFGALVSEYGRITVKAGSIPKAVAGPNLVVIHGRLSPQIADRIEEGFLDIPGTRASVKVHPDARVVVLGD